MLLSLAGMMLLLAMSLPDVLQPLLHLPPIQASTLAIVLPLSSVVHAVANAAWAEEGSADVLAGLWPPLTIVAGLLLLLPQPTLPSPLTMLVLFSTPMLIGLAGTFLGLEHRSLTTFAMALAGAALGAFLLWCATFYAGERTWSPHPWPSLWQIGAEGVTWLLLFVSLSCLGARRWSAMFGITPLLLALEGAALVRPSFGLRQAIALGLVLLGSIYLLLPAPAPNQH